MVITHIKFSILIEAVIHYKHVLWRIYISQAKKKKKPQLLRLKKMSNCITLHLPFYNNLNASTHLLSFYTSKNKFSPKIKYNVYYSVYVFLNHLTCIRLGYHFWVPTFSLYMSLMKLSRVLVLTSHTPSCVFYCMIMHNAGPFRNVCVAL